MKKAPVRTCIVCKRQSDKGDFTRIVRNQEGQVDIDLKGKMAGRGAYICRSTDCILQAIKGNRLNRALRCEIPSDIKTKLEESLISGDAE